MQPGAFPGMMRQHVRRFKPKRFANLHVLLFAYETPGSLKIGAVYPPMAPGFALANPLHEYNLIIEMFTC